MDMFNTTTDIQAKEIPYLTTQWLFQSAGDIIELDAWVPEDVIQQCIEMNSRPELIKRQRPTKTAQMAGPENGPKGGWEYNHVPEGWGLPSNATEVGCMLYDCGDFLFPHRDKWKSVQPTGEIWGDALRLICWANNTNMNEFTFIHDGKIVTFEPRRWYAVNTRKVHSGVCFKDGTVHLAAGVHLHSKGETGNSMRENLEISTNWLLNALPFAQPPQDIKGVNCQRN